MSEKLRKWGIFILPDVIDHAAYEALAELLLTEQAPLRLYCAGDGGSIRDALAMVDLIRAHGDVLGMLAGTAASCHGVIWAGCARRIVYPNAVLGVHKVGYAELNRGFDTHTAGLLMSELDQYEHLNAQIFARASNQSVQWWKQQIQAPGSQEYRIFTAEDLINLGMARPAAMRDVDHDSTSDGEGRDDETVQPYCGGLRFLP